MEEIHPAAEAGGRVPERALDRVQKEKKMRLVKLKPCPFCGGPAKIIQLAHYNIDHGEPAIIGCERCAIYLSRSFVPEDLFHGMPTREEYKATDKEAIDAWNRRAMLDTA